jgi:hypothetical protein
VFLSLVVKVARCFVQTLTDATSNVGVDVDLPRRCVVDVFVVQYVRQPFPVGGYPVEVALTPEHDVLFAAFLTQERLSMKIMIQSDTPE